MFPETPNRYPSEISNTENPVTINIPNGKKDNNKIDDQYPKKSERKDMQSTRQPKAPEPLSPRSGTYTLFLRKLIVIEIDCWPYDIVGITIDSDSDVSDGISLGNDGCVYAGQEIPLNIRRPFKQSIDVFVYVWECDHNYSLSYGQAKSITMNDYQRGPRSLQYALTENTLYELVYEVE